MNPSSAAIALIQQYEGLRLTPYCCSGGRWTIGYGHTVGITPLTPEITPMTAEALLRADLASAAAGVGRLVKVPVTQGQFDALVSFAFNCGVGALEKSTLLRKLNAGDAGGAGREFARWTKAKGSELAGLVRRRSAERALFEADA